jgi:hypothetical protein
MNLSSAAPHFPQRDKLIAKKSAIRRSLARGKENNNGLALR